ncbi:hypothetical protein EVAR_85268_1 [Eumeta japonica]|uniref:Uncharacterized protein n=1 Tax=Eumeta variegata TaxID=151549 RepID=A0A4C1V6S7_EUMVA|nr:hypothetical protein EVAR_85268_1 [Eumeta japonica]
MEEKASGYDTILSKMLKGGGAATLRPPRIPQKREAASPFRPPALRKSQTHLRINKEGSRRAPNLISPLCLTDTCQYITRRLSR